MRSTKPSVCGRYIRGGENLVDAQDLADLLNENRIERAAIVRQQAPGCAKQRKHPTDKRVRHRRRIRAIRGNRNDTARDIFRKHEDIAVPTLRLGKFEEIHGNRVEELRHFDRLQQSELRACVAVVYSSTKRTRSPIRGVRNGESQPPRMSAI